MGGGYTANNQTYAFKTYTPPHKRAKQEERERDRETKTRQIRRYLGLSVFQKLNYTRNTLAKSQHVTCFPETQWVHYECRGSNFKESAMGPGNFTTKRLALESPFCAAQRHHWNLGMRGRQQYSASSREGRFGLSSAQIPMFSYHLIPNSISFSVTYSITQVNPQAPNFNVAQSSI